MTTLGYQCSRNRILIVPKAAWRRVAVTPPGRPTRRPGDATAYMTLEGPGCCHCRYDGGEEGKRKRKATDALDCRRCAGVDQPSQPSQPNQPSQPSPASQAQSSPAKPSQAQPSKLGKAGQGWVRLGKAGRGWARMKDNSHNDSHSCMLISASNI